MTDRPSRRTESIPVRQVDRIGLSSWGRVLGAVAGLAAAAAIGSPTPAEAADQCLAADPPAATAPAQPLRFGITPQLAGTVGEAQGASEPEDPAARAAALAALRPPGRALVIRLNRLFMAGGDAAIATFAARARRYARKGFLVEAQVRYHPAPEQEGDIAAWRRFVRRATKALARNRSLVALSITNEVNLPLSANTSDGAYAGALDAIVTGIPTAARMLRRQGRDDVDVGFTYAYRYLPGADAEFWTSIGARGSEGFREALDYVGVQLYPGLFWPPVLLTETVGEATLEALTLVRECWMAQAGLGPGTAIWVSEIGFATNLGHTEERQAAELEDAARSVHRLSTALGITDFRYFNLRDNRENGLDIFDDVGLLRADYSPKPSFEVFRGLIGELGSDG